MYHFVFIYPDWDVYQAAFRDWLDNAKIEVVTPKSVSPALYWIKRIHCNPGINRKIFIPFKKIWNKQLFRNIPKGKYCFFIVEDILRLESAQRMLPYLRAHYPDSKIVCFEQDLIERTRDLYTGEAIDPEYVKQYCDLFITYDKQEAEKYGLAYFHTVYSLPADIEAMPMSDIDLYFLGTEKRRLPLLTAIAKHITEQGGRCLFILINVPKDKQIKHPGIVYRDKPLSYAENLEYVRRSKCLLEVLQPNATGNSFRMWEAIAYGKRLITNNQDITKSSFYDPTYVTVFTEPEEIQPESEPADDTILKVFKDELQPVNLIRYIEKQLCIRIEL